MTPADSGTSDRPVTLHVGHDELVIRGRYETLSIVNDVLIGVIFLVGSFLFLSESTTTVGTWLFVVGSALMLVRPLIRLTRRIHLRRIHPGADPATSRDF
ncbi:YrhK family protein [Kocuria marina]|uniref:YrhK family protein n=1 Tax=Kocuria marina TaxID=223184 RepID=UPI003F1F15AD